MLALFPQPGRGQAPAAGTPPAKPFANKPDEPMAKELSLARGAEYLDAVTLGWIGQMKCVACHTGHPYLLARASLGGAEAPAVRQVRKFFEDRVEAWDRGGKGAGYIKGLGKLKDTEGVSEVVAVAATLALHDAHSTGKLHPLTRQALDRAWELQRPDGAWAWNKTGLAPFEHDDYYGAVYAALGVGHAPEGYAQGASAKEGISRLRGYLRKHPPPDLHHKAWLLWASLKLDGLLDAGARAQAIKDLLAVQRDDGGWCLPSLSEWKRRDGTANDKQAPSDGYATGLIMYVLLQAGVAPRSEPIQRGVTWLKANQRASGRWFTRSLNRDTGHYITNAGTAFAVMALARRGDGNDE
jgi:squalene-hopene/tetraprenyl-beta-curcumene cyclase